MCVLVLFMEWDIIMDQHSCYFVTLLDRGAMRVATMSSSSSKSTTNRLVAVSTMHWSVAMAGMRAPIAMLSTGCVNTPPPKKKIALAIGVTRLRAPPASQYSVDSKAYWKACAIKIDYCPRARMENLLLDYESHHPWSLAMLLVAEESLESPMLSSPDLAPKNNYFTVNNVMGKLIEKCRMNEWLTGKYIITPQTMRKNSGWMVIVVYSPCKQIRMNVQ